MATNVNFPTYGFVDDIFEFSEANWRQYFRPVVFDSVQNGLEVTSGSGLAVNVAAGECRCGAVMGVMNQSSTLDISGGHSVYSRIDSIAVQYSYGEPSTLSIVVVQGTPAANPVAPAMAQNFGSLWQMEIAQVEVPANASSASQFTITDKRPVHNSLEEEIEVINGQIDAITTDISGINTEILSITTGVAAIDAEIVSITTDISGINSEIDSITTDIASLNSDVEGINTAIDGITASIEGIDTEILSITTDISGIDSQIDSITTDIAGIESEIASITSNIDGIEAEILSITSDIVSLSTSKQDVLTFDSAPTENSTNPVTSGGVFTALSAKADVADLGDLASLNSLDYTSDKLTNKPTLGALSALDTLDYTSNALTNKPTLGTMAAVNDATSDSKAYGRKDGAWYDLDGRYYTESEVDTLLNGKEDTLTFDTEPTENSTNPVTSGGIYTVVDAINTRIDNINNFSIHICTSGEYDPETYVPTIQNPDPTTFYLVPDGTGSDAFTEWIYVNNAWEIFGTAKVDLSDYVTTGDLATALAPKANTADLGDLAFVDTIDYTSNVLTNKPTLGALAALDTMDYTSNYLTNKPTLGALAALDSIDYTGSLITNKPTLGSLADQDTVDYDTEVTNKPTLGALAAKDSVDYSSNEVTNKPTLGTMAAVDDASSDNKAYGRKDGSWYDLDGRYYTEGEVDTLLAGKEDSLTFDSAPTENSTNPVTSGGVYTALSGKQDTLTFDTVPTASSTNPVESGGVKSALDNLLEALLGLITDNVETSTTASKAYAAGDFFVKDNVLYKVSAAIAQGGTITVGTNVVATNLTEQLKKSRFLTRY